MLNITNLDNNQQQELILTLQHRFNQHPNRHENLNWAQIEAKLLANPKKLLSLYFMEQTGGQPNLIDYNLETKELIFMDCSPQTPAGRVNICYDATGEQQRTSKGVYPMGNAQQIADLMGIEILDEEKYRTLQKLGDFDTTTSSWLQTSPKIRKLGGAIFGDKRYGQVFIYHNSAESFYGSRGFRGFLNI